MDEGGTQTSVWKAVAEALVSDLAVNSRKAMSLTCESSVLFCQTRNRVSQVCVCERERERERVCVCLCVSVCVCVCVCEREREPEGHVAHVRE